MNAQMIGSEVQNILSEAQASVKLTDVFVESGNSQSNDVGKKNKGRLRATMLYHELNDEEYAVGSSLKEAEAKPGNKVKFVEIDDATVNTLVDPKNIVKACGKRSDTEKKGIDWKFWLGLIFSIVLAAVSSGIVGSGAGSRIIYLTFAVLLGVALLGFSGAVVAVIIKTVKNIRRKPDASEVDLSEITEWNAKRFAYRSENTVYLVRAPFSGEEPLYWKVFKKYIEFMPEKIVFTCVILKLGMNRTGQHAAVYFKDTFVGDESKVTALNPNMKAYVYGYYLKPLSLEGKAFLVEQLGLTGVISRSYAFYGRDYIYRFGACEDIAKTQATYDKYIGDIYNSAFAESPLKLGDVKYLTAFLACLDRICAGSFRNIMHSNFMETVFGEELLKTLAEAVSLGGDEQSVTIVKNAFNELWLNSHGKLPFIADCNYSLLSYEGNLSENLRLEPYKLAIESYFTYLDNFGLQKRNEYYYRNSFEINLIVDKLIRWNELHEAYFADFFVNILRKVIGYNTVCGLYNPNSALLDVVQKLYEDTRGTSYSDTFDEFFISKEVKTAFMQDAVVLPVSANLDSARYNGSVSNYCRERHKTYLKRRTTVMNLTHEVNTYKTIFYELFGTSEDTEEYFSLMYLHEEDSVAEFFAALYGICDSVLKEKFDCLTVLDVIEETNANVTGSGRRKAIFDKMFGYKLFITDAVNKLREVLKVDNCNDIVKIALSGKSSGEELLSCGLLYSELFYLLNDLYLAKEKKLFSKIDGYFFSEYINSKTYKLIDNLVFVEKIEENRFTNVFSELVDCVDKSGKLYMFLKYFLAAINQYDVSPNNQNIMKQYLLRNAGWKLKLLSDNKPTNAEAEALLMFIFSVKNNFDPEQFRRICWFLQTMIDKDILGEDMKDFVRYVIYEEEPSFENEEQEREFVEKLNSYSAEACYLIFNALMWKNENILKHVILLKEKLPKASYVHKLHPFMLGLKFFDGEDRTSIIEIIVDNIDYKSYNRRMLINCLTFIRDNEAEIDSIKENGYAQERMQRLFERIIHVEAHHAADMYYHLSQDSGYVFIYAKYLFEMMAMFMNTAPSEDTPADIDEVYSKFGNTEILFEKNGEKFICKEYVEFVDGIVRGKFGQAIDGNTVIKILGDLLKILNDKTVRLPFEPETRVSHGRLLSSIRERLIPG